MEQTEISKELMELYINRPIEEEHLNFEEFVILNNLRVQRNKDVESTRKYLEFRANLDKSKTVNLGDRVWFKIDESLLGGIIRKINKDGTYDISSSMGYYKNIEYLRKRIVEDLGHIKIPEKLKTLSTERLYHMYRRAFRFNHGWNPDCRDSNSFNISGENYSLNELKAELNTREHIYSMKDKRLLKKMRKA